MVGLGILVLLSLEDLPSIDALKNYQPPQSTVVLDRNGSLVGRFYDERRTVIPLKSLPAHVKLAFIAAEDGDFFEHGGIDYFGLFRAVLLEIKYRTIGGRRVGGSTITQQTARTMLLSQSQTYGRKIKEMVLAQRIEKALSKDEILHLYLNQIYFGNGAYGIEEAAQTYFLKPASKLTLFEAAALASVPKSPNRINPFSDAERLRQRQHYVLDQMVKHKFVDQKDADEAKQAPLFSEIADGGKEKFASYFLEAIKNEVLQKVSEEAIHKGGLKVFSTLDVNMQRVAEQALSHGLRVIDKRFGYRGPIVRPKPEENDKLKAVLEVFKKRAFIADNKDKIWDLSRLSQSSINAGLNQSLDKIRTTRLLINKIVGARVLNVDNKTQTATVDLGSKKASLSIGTMPWARPYSEQGQKPFPKNLSDIVKPGDIILVKIVNVGHNLTVSLEQEPLVNGGLVALDVSSGGVLAMVGGYDFDKSPFNRITQAKRQPGSGIKPLIYALAIDQELATAASIITDAPKVFLDPGTNEYWRPRNHTNKFLGDITLRRCLRSSVNICTITLLEKMGLDAFLNLAREVELVTKDNPYPRNLTIALGSAENYPITVANAMRVLANRGIYSPYHLIDGIKEASGERKKLFTPTSKVVFRPQTTFIVSRILEEVVSDSNRHKYLSMARSTLSGKTGTTNNARSAWFFGYSPAVLALVYVGYDDNRSIGSNEWGATTAFPIWARFMNDISVNHQDLRFFEPEGIEWRYIDRDTGRVKDRINTSDEMTSNGVMEAFISGTAPDASPDNIVRTAPDFADESAFSP